MKTIMMLSVAAVWSGVLLLPAVYARQGTAENPAIDLLELKSAPEGDYLLNLQSGGTERFVNIEVKGDSGKGVNGSDPELKGLEGKFELIGNGVLRAVFRNKEHTASQWWLFRPDGSAIVREVPDRGEKQRAIPVADASLDLPTARRP